MSLESLLPVQQSLAVLFAAQSESRHQNNRNVRLCHTITTMNHKKARISEFHQDLLQQSHTQLIAEEVIVTPKQDDAEVYIFVPRPLTENEELLQQQQVLAAEIDRELCPYSVTSMQYMPQLHLYGAEQVISRLTCVFDQHFQQLTPANMGDPATLAAHELTRFHSRTIPGISVHHFMQRLVRYSECSLEALVQAASHIFALPLINPFTIHRLLLSSLLCAVKFFDDSYYNNLHYARIGGVSLQELNILEADFLQLLNFDLHQTPEQYQFYYQHLLQELHHNCNCSTY